MKAPCKNTWTGVRWLLLARGACGSGRLWGACAQSDGGLALSRRGHVHPRSGFGHGRLCSTAYPPSGFPLGVFLWPSSLVFLFIPLAALVSSFCVIVFVCATLFRGRRQLPQAGEVRRPPGPACERRWVDIDLRHSRNETETEGARPSTVSSPPPPGAPLEPARSKWGFGGDEKERFVCTTAPLFFSAFSCMPNVIFCPCNP